MSLLVGKEKRIWTPEEDELLIQCLVEMRDKGHFVADNGFKLGHLRELETMMGIKSPGCGLLAIPHIQSRLKTLKNGYHVVYDLLNASGFGWDAGRHCVTADKEVWDEYIKGNKKAASFRHKPFPHYNVLGTIFGKDRATGKDAQSYQDVVEEMQDQTIREAANDIIDETDLGLDMDNMSLGNSSLPSEATSGNRKCRRNSTDRDEIMLQGMEKIANTLAQSFKDATENLGLHVDRVEREKRMDQLKESLYAKIMNVEGVAHHQKVAAYVKMISDESMFIGFDAMPDAGKADVIRQIVA